jgi:Phage head-tail joining protein
MPRFFLSRDDLPHRIDVRRDLGPQSQVTDDGAGRQANWTVVAHNWPCFVQTLSVKEALAFARLGLTLTHQVYLRRLPDPGLRNGDQLLFGARVFDVLSVRDEFESGWFYTIMAREIL